MSTVEITRVEDVRAGDRVSLTRNRTLVVGTVRDVAHGEYDYTYLDIAALPCSLVVGDGYWTFLSATREVPDLPTEPGSVIVNATIRGVPGRTAVLDPEGNWITLKRADGFWSHDPVHITAWEPGRIGYEGGAS